LNAVLSCTLTYSLTDSGHIMNYCISLRERGTRCSIGSRLNLGNRSNVEVHGLQFAPVDCSYNVGNLLWHGRFHVSYCSLNEISHDLYAQ